MPQYALALDDQEYRRYNAQAERAQETENPSWTLAGIRPGAHVVDLGCGPGATLRSLAEVVGSDGSVTGVDSSAEAVARAREVVEDESRAPVTVLEGEATHSGLPEASFDAVLVRLVLAHNGGAEQDIVDHAAALLRPGGGIVLVDVDMTLVRFAPLHPPLGELYAAYVDFQRNRGNDPSVGLRLGALLEHAGLELVHERGDVTIHRRRPGVRGPAWAAREAMLAEGAVTEADLARWEAEFGTLDRVDHGNQPRTFLCGFTAVGRATPAGGRDHPGTIAR